MGVAVIYFSEWRLVPLAIGLGIVAYALAVAFYTLLGIWRMRRSAIRAARLAERNLRFENTQPPPGKNGKPAAGCRAHRPPNLRRNRPAPSNMYSPTLDEFLKLAAQGNLIPVTRRLLADIETPLSAYRKIRGPGESFLFESVEGGEHLGRYSFVGCNPRAVIRQDGQTVEVIENGKVVETLEIQAEGAAGRLRAAQGLRDGLEVVERVMKKYRAVPVPGLPRFTGGAVGFIGYEFIHDVEPVVPRPPQDDLQTPVMYFLIADQLLIFDRVAQTITVLVNAVLDDAASPAEAYENADWRNRAPRLAARTAERASPGERARRSAARCPSSRTCRRKSSSPTS